MSLSSMRTYLNSLDWIKRGLFWRTFILLGLLVMTSMGVWFVSLKMLERTPLAQKTATQMMSIVTMTRAALTHSAPEKRRELLYDLANESGVRVYPLEDNDEIEAQDLTSTTAEFQALIKEKLGANTRFAKIMNGIDGFWISFSIEGDQYWLRLDPERIDQSSNIQVVGWVTVTLFSTLIGAAIISKLINDPLARLSAAALMLAKGKQPAPLPEKGPKEIRDTNASFNQMLEDLERIESDRAVILAGISHDLRTPLARMQLEVEMANLSDDARHGMRSDLEQMDDIIGQFLDYAKPLSAVSFEEINLSEMLTKLIEESSRLHDVHIRYAIAPNVTLLGNVVELRRMFHNLIENSRRYGKTPGTDTVKIDFQCTFKNKEKRQGILISMRDYGQGIPEDDMTRLLRPFTRADTSRS